MEPIEESSGTFQEGVNHGAARTVYYLHIVMKGYLKREHFEQHDFDAASWERLKEIMDKLTDPRGH